MTSNQTNQPCQEENKSKTPFGMAHWTPNKPNILHKSVAIGQWRSRWSTVSHLIDFQRLTT